MFFLYEILLLVGTYIQFPLCMAQFGSLSGLRDFETSCPRYQNIGCMKYRAEFRPTFLLFAVLANF